MMTTTAADTARYKRHRYPTEIISHAVWLYSRFTLSYRDVEELLAARGINVTYETIRQGCLKFGQLYANQRRRRRPQPGDKGHIDEVFLKINGETWYLWRAVDQYGNVLDILVTSRRAAQAAKRFFRKLLGGCKYVPRVIITDKWASYGAAKRDWGRKSRTARINGPSTGRKTRSNQPGKRSASCVGSSRRAMHNGFCPPWSQYEVISG